MKKIKVKYFLIGGILFGPVLALLILTFRSVGDRPDEDYWAVEKATKGISCPAGAAMVYEPWGESGRMAKCQLAHGTFIAAEHGHIVVKGEYYMGKLIKEEKAP